MTFEEFTRLGLQDNYLIIYERAGELSRWATSEEGYTDESDTDADLWES